MRPKSLSEVAQWALNGEPFGLAFREFLDEFYAHPQQAALAEEPARLASAVPERGEIYDAYLAATAEALACGAGLDTPSWSYQENRKLRRPWFALPYASLRAVLLHESPAAFRSRNLFVSANALSRV